MPAAHETVLDAQGYLFQIPCLGLPDPGGEWVTLRAAIGTKKQCTSLLETCKPTDAKLCKPDGNYEVVEAEHDGAVWFFPMLRLLKGGSKKPELLSVNVRRQPISSPPKAYRLKLPSGIDVAFLNKSTKLFEYKGSSWTRVKEDDDDEELDLAKDFNVNIRTPDSHKLDESVAMEAVELMRICRNPTAAQAEPARPPSDPSLVVQWSNERSKIRAHAYKLWDDQVNEKVNKDWLRKVHKDAVAAGLRQPTFNAKSQLARFRISREDDWDIRGYDYALDSEKGLPEDKLEWLPMPAHAADPEWVRCGVNLFRSGIGRRLITKEEWPPKPTTLMMKKGPEK